MAPKNNLNAKKDGHGDKLRIRVRRKQDVRFIIKMLDPEARGAALLAAAETAYNEMYKQETLQETLHER